MHTKLGLNFILLICKYHDVNVQKQKRIPDKNKGRKTIV